MVRITGVNGVWEIEIEDFLVFADTIRIKFLPRKNPQGCKNIFLAQTCMINGYDQEGNIVSRRGEDLSKDPADNTLGYSEDDAILDENGNAIGIDHLTCSADPFSNGTDLHDPFSRGDATTGEPTEMSDTPRAALRLKLFKDNIVKIVFYFETCAICLDSGEILGSINWQVTFTRAKEGKVELTSSQEGPPSENFKKAFQKYVENHARQCLTEPDHLLRWYCPETSYEIKGPFGEFCCPYGLEIPEGIRKKWIPDFIPALEPGGIRKPITGKKVVFKNYELGGGRQAETFDEILKLGLKDPGSAALKFTWSGNQIKSLKSILFTPYQEVNPKNIAPFISRSNKFLNDLTALEAFFVTTQQMKTMLKLIAESAKLNKQPKAYASVSIIANMKGKEAVVLTMKLDRLNIDSFVKKAALHKKTTPEILEVLHYLGLNFGSLGGNHPEKTPPPQPRKRLWPFTK